MALMDINFAKTRSPLADFVARVFETPFDRRQKRIAARIKMLRALSDTDLAARGLRRQDIIPHVFASMKRG